MQVLYLFLFNLYPGDIQSWFFVGAKYMLMMFIINVLKASNYNWLQLLQFRLLYTIFPEKYYLHVTSCVFCSSENKDRKGNTTFFFHKLCKVPSIWSNPNLNTRHASSLRIGFDVVSILLGAKIMLSRNNTDTYLLIQYLKQYFTGLKRNIAKHIRDLILLIQQFKHMFLLNL